MKKLLTLILAVMLLCSLTLPAFADSTIDLTQIGSVNLWKYDLSSAQADGVWDSSYVSTGVRDQSGVEAILGASGSSSGYAPKTGDEGNVPLYAVSAVGSAAAVFFLSRTLKKRRK